ncbi:flagellar basal body-associated protein FliL [Alkalicoccus luteus]|uniref:Flagellar protein FliL n=1 Tax=Alkalicoccus luteus TaxID=1237094 RepID=A0A969PMX0_9BACI|nr:flagellar basal body-associated protein FliL [Alkalicoccus luteus]NJP36345.1 flagellar basal body-associated protein FliL [Alkalicoccus luteus]
MLQNRLLNVMLMVLAAMTLIGIITFFLYTQFFETSAEGEEEPRIEEIISRSLETEEITTNLYSNQIIRSSFVLQADSEDAKAELEMRQFQVENIIIGELSDRSVDDFRGSEGIRSLEDSIRDELNQLMTEGNVVEVYMNQKVIQ